MQDVQLDNPNIYTIAGESCEKGEKGEKGEKIQNEILKAKIDFNTFDVINYITLETMSNNESYNKYLRRNKMDHDAVLKREKKFYRKRIIALTKDILFNNVNTGANTNTGATPESTLPLSLPILPSHPDIPKVDDVILSAFNAYARLCISHFKFKDTMDTIQGEYKDINDECGERGVNAGIGDEDAANNLNEANKLCMKQNDKKILTLDNYVIKTSAPKKEMILPKTKNVNLKDPKFKKKDIKISLSMAVSPSCKKNEVVPDSTN